MTKIKTLYDTEGNKFVPRTHVKAVTDDNGNSLASILDQKVDDSELAAVKSIAETAKNAVATLDGLSNTTTAQETLAAQVTQIEENKQNIALNKADADAKLTELSSEMLEFEKLLLHNISGTLWEQDITFTASYQWKKLDKPIYKGQVVYIEGADTQLNFYVEQTNVSGQNTLVKNGDKAIKDFTWCRCLANTGNVKISIKSGINNVISVPILTPASNNLHTNYYPNAETLASDATLAPLPCLIKRDKTQTQITVGGRVSQYNLHTVFLNDRFEEISRIYINNGATGDIPDDCEYFYFIDYKIELVEHRTMACYGNTKLDFEPFVAQEYYTAYNDMIKGHSIYHTIPATKNIFVRENSELVEGESVSDLIYSSSYIIRDMSETQITMSQRTLGYQLGIEFYDANYRMISRVWAKVASRTKNIPTNCRYIRFVDYVAECRAGGTMVNYGSSILPYEPFVPIDSIDLYSVVKEAEKVVSPVDFLIKEPILMSSTKEHLIYINDALTKKGEYRTSVENSHYNLVGGIGYVNKPSVGSKTGVLHIANEYSVLDKEIKTITYSPPTNKSVINMLDIGSSYIDIQQITKRQKSNYENDGYSVNLIGTMGSEAKHEARSGGTWDFLIKPLGRAVIVDVNGVSNLPITGYPGTTYMDSNGVKWTVRGVMVSNGSGKIVLSSFSVNTNYDGGAGSSSTNYDIAAENIPSVGVLTKTSNDSTGTSTTQGDDTISYTSKELVYYNPFWNPTTNELDFAYYINKWGFDAPDVISLTFGSNDLGNSVMQSDSTVSFVTNKAVQVVDKIHQQYPNCKILITTSCYGYDGNSAKENQVPIRKHNLQKYYLSLVEKMGLNTEYASYVAIVPTLCMVDRVNGFSTYEIAPCSLYDTKIVISGDMTHPNYLGFYQYADAMLGYAYKLLQS